MERHIAYWSFAGVILLCIAFTSAGLEVQEWIEVTDRLQLQIDECRRDTRDLSIVERRLDDLEAEVLFLREQIGMLEEGERKKAAMMWQFEVGVGE